MSFSSAADLSANSDAPPPPPPPAQDNKQVMQNTEQTKGGTKISRN